MNFRPNPPRLITIAIAIALLVAGVAGALFPQDVVALIHKLPFPKDLEKQMVELARDQTLAYLSALAAPVLLAIGSLLPGI